MEKKRENIFIHDTSIVDETVTMGKNIEIMSFCNIGDIPITFDNTLFRFKRMKPKYSVIMNNDIFVGSHSSIMKGITRDTIIGSKVILGQFSNIGHDSIIKDGVRIMNNVSVDGYVTIDSGTFIGTGCKIRNRMNIGYNCLIGQGSNVVKDIPPNSFAYGNPCRVIRKNYSDIKSIIRRMLI